MSSEPEIQYRWFHLQYDEFSDLVETYGFSGNQGVVNLEGILLLPRDRPSDTLLVFMHPSSTLQLLPVPRELARQGCHVLCAASRYARNDTSLILEKVLLDLAAYIRHAKEQLGYRRVVLMGWSGGGALALFYQAQAEQPTIVDTPAGDPIGIVKAGPIPADAVVFQAAHISRATLLLDMLDPSLRSEIDPDERDPELDIYDPRNPNQPPYTPDFIAAYRAAQRARMDHITGWVEETLARLKRRNTAEIERPFLVHRTVAEPRFLDPMLDPNDRRPGWCYLGKPETANSGPVGLARFSTLRSWLSQWSIDHTRADGIVNAAKISVPLLAIENSADDAVPQPHIGQVFAAAASSDKTMKVIKGATHYYSGQQTLLADVTRVTCDWLGARRLLAR